MGARKIKHVNWSWFKKVQNVHFSYSVHMHDADLISCRTGVTYDLGALLFIQAWLA